MPVCTYLLGPSEDEAEESVMERGASLSGQSAVRLVAFLKSAGQVRQQDICTLQLVSLVLGPVQLPVTCSTVKLTKGWVWGWE